MMMMCVVVLWTDKNSSSSCLLASKSTFSSKNHHKICNLHPNFLPTKELRQIENSQKFNVEYSKSHRRLLNKQKCNEIFISQTWTYPTYPSFALLLILWYNTCWSVWVSRIATFSQSLHQCIFLVFGNRNFTFRILSNDNNKWRLMSDRKKVSIKTYEDHILLFFNSKKCLPKHETTLNYTKKCLLTSTTSNY